MRLLTLLTLPALLAAFGPQMGTAPRPLTRLHQRKTTKTFEADRFAIPVGLLSKDHPPPLPPPRPNPPPPTAFPRVENHPILLPKHAVLHLPRGPVR